MKTWEEATKLNRTDILMLVVIDLDYNLIDGYTSYLIAKNYNKTTVIAKLKRNKEMEGK